MKRKALSTTECQPGGRNPRDGLQLASDCPDHHTAKRCPTKTALTPTPTPRRNTPKSTTSQSSGPASGLSSENCAAMRTFVPPAIRWKQDGGTWAKIGNKSNSTHPPTKTMQALLLQQAHLFLPSNLCKRNSSSTGQPSWPGTPQKNRCSSLETQPYVDDHPT